MRTRLLALPGALEFEGEIPLSQALGDAFRTLGSGTTRAKIVSDGRSISEAAWLGLDPRRFDTAPGVLAVAAFGADPPDRSVHFQLTVLSLADGRIRRPDYRPLPEEVDAIVAAITRLETSRLRIVKGRELEHGLVWEDGSIELGTSTPDDAEEKELRSAWPEGDGEAMLRRLIDDSVNLLSELESNRRREEDGQLPFNLVWPWGHGFRPKIPNLVVERGVPATFVSNNFRQLGMCRIAGYRHSDPWAAGEGTRLRLEDLLASMCQSTNSVMILGDLGRMREDGQFDELEWLGSEMDQRLLAPLIEEAKAEDVRLTLLATDRNGKGLAARFEPRSFGQNRMPFSAEMVADAKSDVVAVHEFMAKELSA